MERTFEFLSKAWDISPVLAVVIGFCVLAFILWRAGYFVDKEPVDDPWRTQVERDVENLKATVTSHGGTLAELDKLTAVLDERTKK